MKKQINKRWQSLLLATIATFIVLGASDSVFAQNGIGKKYNSRDPRPCSEVASKTKVPTNAEVVASVICNSEREAGIETLFLVDDVKVTQIGKGTPYVRRVYPNMSDIDLDFLIYPIRGSFKKYQCTLSDGKTREKSCLLYDEAKAEGRCFKNGFGQWVCGMTDLTVRDSIKVFPPGSAQAAAKAPAKNNPDATNGDKPTDQPIERDENGFPKPDFSEMEKAFEIRRMDYDFTLGRFNLLVKPTKNVNICDWYITFYDADEIKVKESSFTSSLCSYQSGEAAKIYAYAPSEKEMKEVTKITVTRKVR